MLDLSILEKAIATLQNAFQLYDENPMAEDAPGKILQRDGAIQRFEFTFELSWKTLKRYIELSGMEQIDKLYMRDLFRVGFEMGVIDDPVKWFNYLKMRNKTSHIYDDEIAHQVFCTARDFVPDALSLLERMKEKAQ